MAKKQKKKGPANTELQQYKMHYRNCFYEEFKAMDSVINRRDVKVDNKTLQKWSE